MFAVKKIYNKEYLITFIIMIVQTNYYVAIEIIYYQCKIIITAKFYFRT